MECNDKKLGMRHTFKDLSVMMGISYSTLRDEVLNNKNLVAQLNKMGWRSYMRFRKQHVLEIFKVIGYPDGYEWYENDTKQ